MLRSLRAAAVLRESQKKPQREQQNQPRTCHPHSPTSRREGGSRVLAPPWPHHAEQTVNQWCNETIKQIKIPALCSVLSPSWLFARKGTTAPLWSRAALQKMQQNSWLVPPIAMPALLCLSDV